MALMERVATLLRANLQELLVRAEDPEKMMRQVVLDMENQLLQLKTQVAMALADGHLLEKKAHEQEEAAASWHRKAELAVSKEDDDLARAALERALNHENLLAGYRDQVAVQRADSEGQRSTYTKLQAKLAETKAQSEILLARHRRDRLVSNAAEARLAAESGRPAALVDAALSRMGGRPGNGGGQKDAAMALQFEASLEERFATLEKVDRVEQLLQELKSRNLRTLARG